MYFKNIFDLPQELLGRRPGQINILVGENGSGKSSLLDILSKDIVLSTNRKVVAIANTIHDKFSTRHKRFEILKAANGRSIVKRTIKSALMKLIEQREHRFNQVAETLRYVNFEPVIGIKIVGLKTDVQEKLIYTDFSDNDRKKVSSLLFRYQKFLNERYGDNVLRIDLYRSSFYEYEGSVILELLAFEPQLRKAKLIRDIEISFQKDGELISANMGSSGELTLITSFVYLMTTIEHGTWIFIDEPENSLHPKWQVEYIYKLYDLIYRYEPTTFIATHSPLIINSAELNLGERVKIFKGINGSFKRMKDDVNNVEEIYQDFFDVTTPENRFLSTYVVGKLNQLGQRLITIGNFREVINDLSESAYDPRQKEVLIGVLQMGEQIAERNR